MHRPIIKQNNVQFFTPTEDSRSKKKSTNDSGQSESIGDRD